MTINKRLQNIFIAIALFASLCRPCVLSAVAAQPVAEQAAALLPPAADDNISGSVEATTASGQRPSFIYNRERLDPFFPFLSKEIAKEAKAKAELPGTQKFEPSQLVLVAIVAGNKGLLAMAQDSSGVGYVLRQGTKIGENSKVTHISKEKVVIEQTLKNVFGERVTKKVEMMLNKEGEK